MVIAGCHLTSFQNETNVPDRSSPHFSLQLVVDFAESRIPVNPRSLAIFKRLNVFLPLIMATSLLKESMTGCWATKTGINLYIFILSTYTGEIFGFINFEKLNPLGIMANTNLTNQRQVFVEEYVRSVDHLEVAKKA